MNLALLPQAPVWVLDDPRSPAGGQASAIAGRLGLPFRRLNAPPGQPHRPGGPGPGLVLSAGTASGLRALLLQSRHGCRVVHCATRSLLGPRGGWLPFDLTVVPIGRHVAPPETGRIIPVLGTPNVVSPGLLARARDLWSERLSHLPAPRVLLLFGGVDQKAALALGQRLGAMARERGGCVMASVLPSVTRAGNAAAADALAAGLAGCLHLIYRDGEPGEDPTLGFLGHADAVVVASVSARTLSEACTASVPIFSTVLGAERRDTRLLIERMIQADQIRMLEDDFSPWPRRPLDEAGRIAREIRMRFGRMVRREGE